MVDNSLKRKRHKTVEYGRYGYFFIAPFFIVYLMFQLWPLLYTVWMSFMEYYSRGMKEVGPSFIGVQNFINIMVDTDASGAIKEGAKWFDTFTFKALYNTLYIWMFNFIPQVSLALLLAAWFTDAKVKLRGQGAYKVIIFMPNIITAATIAVLFYSLFNLYGPITDMLRNVGVINDDFDFMRSETATRLIVAFIQFWMWYGNTMILLISGILGINPSLFEAGRVDGASSKQLFRRITLPLLKPIMLYVLVTSAIGGLQMYDIPAVYNINNTGDPLPDNAALTITMYIRKLAKTSKDFGKASAVSMILFAVTLAISLVFFYVMRDKKEPGMKKRKKVGRGA
jgi:cellobiose transport system permease protein